jgi:hypothetical protein
VTELEAVSEAVETVTVAELVNVVEVSVCVGTGNDTNCCRGAK